MTTSAEPPAAQLLQPPLQQYESEDEVLQLKTRLSSATAIKAISQALPTRWSRYLFDEKENGHISYRQDKISGTQQIPSWDPYVSHERISELLGGSKVCWKNMLGH
jgi:hypothetical protein